MLNALDAATSPFLSHHADNSVNWYPWGQEALDKACTHHLPVFLFIGYAASYWSQRMAREAFADPAAAALMNQNFINILVDRDEQPALAKIYQTTHVLLTERAGGWPLTVFLTPEDQTPFFSGAYYPALPRAPLPAWRDVLTQINAWYRHRHLDVRRQNHSLHVALQVQSKPSAESVIDFSAPPIIAALADLQENFDPRFGGFGGAPKFPQAPKLEFLLRTAPHSAMILPTLLNMAQHGLYDHLGGGFFHYTIDTAWQMPHTTKALDENAQLLMLYARSARHFAEPYFAQVAVETGTWALTEMQAPTGGFYATQATVADEPESAFYTWSDAELKHCLTGAEYHLVRTVYGLDNFTQTHARQYLRLVENLWDKQEKLILQTARQKLLAARRSRTGLQPDTRINTAAHALLCKGLLIAGHLLGVPAFTAAAMNGLAFAPQHLWRQQRLHASFVNGAATRQATLDDYAFLLDACLTAAATRSDQEDKTRYYDFARQLGAGLLAHFYDAEHGGFFYTAHDAEKLLYRPKIFIDDATPAGNSVAARNLFALAQLDANPAYRRAAEQTLALGWPALQQHPAEHGYLLLAALAR